jgi:hypothetical protein
MQLDNVLGKYNLIPLVFSQAEVAASQTDVALFTAEVHGGVALETIGYVMPFKGEIIAVSANLSAAATGGLLSLAPTVDATATTDPVLAITTATAASDTCRRGSNPFAKGSLVGCKITTSGAWTAETMDLNVIVWVILTLGGI